MPGVFRKTGDLFLFGSLAWFILGAFSGVLIIALA